LDSPFDLSISFSISNIIMVKAAMPMTNFAPRCLSIGARGGPSQRGAVAFPTGYQIILGIGFFGAAMGGAYTNYLLEQIPDHGRPAHLAWYNIALNAAVLVGSFLGPFVADSLGLAYALMLFAVMRVLAGFIVLRWG
jgi:hypothetical protein